MWMMVAFVLGEVAAYQMGMTVWFIIAAALFVFHRKLCPMKHKAHSFSPAVIKTAEGRGDSDFQTDAERVWNWKDPMMCRVFLLFFCFLAGWGRMTVEMRPDALERMVTQKGGSVEVAVSGTLDSISEKNGWCRHGTFFAITHNRFSFAVSYPICRVSGRIFLLIVIIPDFACIGK